MASAFKSERLIFRAVETPADNAFFYAIQTDPAGYANANAEISKPQNAKSGEQFQKYVAEEAMLGVIFCLPSTAEGQDSTPIGVMHLGPLEERHAHHSHSMIGIDVLPQYQGQGYGTEAIKWVLRWAFVTRGLHRVEIGCFAWNTGARKVYERIGFKVEGVKREKFWHEGKWWDDIEMGMLASEWQELYGEKGA